MPVVTGDRQGVEVAVTDRLADWVVTLVEIGLDLEASAGGGGCDELDDGCGRW